LQDIFARMTENTTPNRAAGGHARAEKLSKDKLSEIGRKAALSRWNKDLPQADYEGTLTFGIIKFKCAVIEKPDGSALRLISQTEFMDGMGMYYSGYIAKQHREKDTAAGLPMFLAQTALKPFVEANLDVLQFEPISYVAESGGVAKGIPAEIVSKICKVWVEAKRAGALGKARRMLRIADNAAIIRDALADTGMVALVDEATGYQDVRARDALQVILNAFLRKSFAAWSKRIPDEFYKEIYRLRGWQWPGMEKNRFQIVGKYTTDLVYKRLAPGVQEELDRRNPKNDKGRRSSKHHQWLTENIGHPALSQHLHAVLGFMRASRTWNQFKSLVDVAFPIQGSTVQIEMDLQDAQALPPS
jgi:hypothetical protein